MLLAMIYSIGLEKGTSVLFRFFLFLLSSLATKINALGYGLGIFTGLLSGLSYFAPVRIAHKLLKKRGRFFLFITRHKEILTKSLGSGYAKLLTRCALVTFFWLQFGWPEYVTVTTLEVTQ